MCLLVLKSPKYTKMHTEEHVAFQSILHLIACIDRLQICTIFVQKTGAIKLYVLLL